MNKKEVLKTAIDDFRKKYIHQLEINMDVAIEIRDNEEATSRDRNEAIKTISRMLGALQPDRQTTQKDAVKAVTLSDEEQSEIDAQIDAILKK